MITEYNSLDERCLSIYENDMINGSKVLILKVYCTKRDNGVWELPAPQIFNKTVYEANKVSYDDAVQAFRNDCLGSVNESSSVILTEIDSLKKDNEMIMLAIADLASTMNPV